MLAVVLSVSLSHLEIDPSEELTFLHWMRENSKFYTGSEYFLRLGIFLSNQRFVRDFNRRNAFRLSTNKFACMSPSEYRSMLNTQPTRTPPKHSRQFTRKSQHREISVDWRTKGVVSPIKDQGQCAAGWAFATTQAQESAVAIAESTLQEISSSNLIDCVSYCSGCEGGFSYQAFDYVIDHQNGQFMLLSDYPDTQEQQECKFNPEKSFSHVFGYSISWSSDEEELVDMCNAGVLAVTIDASQNSFMLYKSGVYNDSQCSKLDPNGHVGIVGFGTEGDVNYWIIRNSYGQDWGEDGYMRMLRGSNVCGIAELAIHPIITDR